MLKEYILQNGTTEDWYNSLHPEKLIFEWINATEYNYKNFIRHISIENIYKNYLPIDIDSPHNLPWNRDYTNWGTDVAYNDKGFTVDNLDFGIEGEMLIVERLSMSKNKLILVEDERSYVFYDTRLSFSGNIFYLRESADGTQYYFNRDEKPIFYKKDLTTKGLFDKLIPSVEKDKFLSFNIGTIDLETYLDNGEHKILCSCVYDGVNYIKQYINDYDSQDSLISDLLNNLLIEDNNNKSFFIHNGSTFDLVFILKNFISNPNINLDIQYKDGKFLNIKVNYTIGKNKYSFNIKDSLLLLPSSLASLAKSFNLEDKGIFPYTFPNKK